MMLLVLMAAAAIGYWAWKTRDAQTMRIGDVAAVVAALIGLRLMSRGSDLQGLVALAGAGWWLWFRRRGANADWGADAAMTPTEARRVLNVPADATREEISTAHRRLIARVHPDVGGSADLTRQVNAARDTLLRNSA
ncbi:molecular chaperone DnaJ [Sphingomonas sp. MMS24-J13]|uniref:molecular chaperone DnaJ n=1 Tax=Sphingomonas sp. MMS24-J13 TaxID=3238686 RepID=UPI00384C7CCB